MAKKKKPRTKAKRKAKGKAKSVAKGALTSVIRNKMIDSGVPLLRLANETGVTRACLIRFRQGTVSIRLDTADKLADYFGLSLVEKKKKS